MYPKYVEVRIHQKNYLVASSWHFTLFHEEDVRSNNPQFIMHFIYLPAAKLLYLIQHFQKTYLKLNEDYFLCCGFLQPLTTHAEHRESVKIYQSDTSAKQIISTLRTQQARFMTALQALLTFTSL